MEISSNAPVISRHQIAISVPLESVWLVLDLTYGRDDGQARTKRNLLRESG